MTFRIGVDVGGTFTDYVGVRDDADVVSGKTPSTPGRESVAVMRAVERIAAQLGVATEELLGSTEVINFGTTVATNAMLEHTGAPVGMLTTKGFRDIVDLRRGYKESLTDIRLTAPRPIARRRHRIGVTERIDGDGTVLVPLDEQEVRDAVRRLRDEGIEAYAVCLLQAPANPAHERRCAELIEEGHPGAHVSLSVDVLNQIGEFERFSTTLMNAYLSPVLRDYMAALLDELARRGFQGRLLVMQSNGGTGEAREMARSGVGALLSGPAAGVVAASELAGAVGFVNVIGVDMGGTSYDVSLVRGGRPQVRTDAWAGRYRVGVSMLDIHTIGAGGGSIAWIDAGGALRVGPESAGALPGPACYGRDGTRPTVTDANLVLGYLSDENFAGGEMTLDRGRALAAIEEHVAEPLDIDPIEAAIGIGRIVNSNMANGIRYVSVARGHDPRDFALMAFGGAAAAHAPVQARDLGIRTILVPKAAGVLSAYGTLLSDLKVSTLAPYLRLADAVDLDEINGVLDALWAARRDVVDAGDVQEIQRRRFADFRYAGQVHELTVPVAAGDGQVDEDDWNAAIAAFHDAHERLYTFKLLHKPVEVITLRQDLVGVRRKLRWTPGANGAGPLARAPKHRRTAWLPGPDGAFAATDVPVYDGRRVGAGETVEGPAVVEEDNTTIVLNAGDSARLDPLGIYVVAVAEPER